MYNKVTLIGNLGKDPEIRKTQANKTMAKLNVATSESYKDKATGEYVKKTEWHNVVVYSEPNAKYIGEYLTKGSTVLIEGKIQTRSYEKDGDKKYITEIVASSVTGFFKEGREPKEEKPKDEYPYEPTVPQSVLDDEIPF